MIPKTQDEAGASGSGSSSPLSFQPGDMVVAASSAVTETTSDETHGFQIMPLRAGDKVVGLRVFSSVARTVKATFWSSSGTAVATGTGSAAAGQWSTITFTAPYTFLPTDVGTLFTGGAYVSGGHGVAVADGFSYQGSTYGVPFISGAFGFSGWPKRWVSGDAMPTTDASSEHYAVDPVFSS